MRCESGWTNRFLSDIVYVDKHYPEEAESQSFNLRVDSSPTEKQKSTVKERIPTGNKRLSGDVRGPQDKAGTAPSLATNTGPEAYARTLPEKRRENITGGRSGGKTAEYLTNQPIGEFQPSLSQPSARIEKLLDQKSIGRFLTSRLDDSGLQIYKDALNKLPFEGSDQERLARERKRAASAYLDESIALAHPIALRLLGWLCMSDRLDLRRAFEVFGASTSSFEGITRLHLIGAVKFDEGDLTITSLGKRVLDRLGLIDRKDSRALEQSTSTPMLMPNNKGETVDPKEVVCQNGAS